MHWVKLSVSLLACEIDVYKRLFNSSRGTELSFERCKTIETRKGNKTEYIE